MPTVEGSQHHHHLLPAKVTDLVFLDSNKKLVTCSKDKFIQVWDLDTQHCLQIIGGQATTTSGQWVLILARNFWCLTWSIQSCGCSESGNQLKRVKIGTNGMHFIIDLLL